MQLHLERCTLGKREIAPAFSLNTTQDLLRLGSGAHIYPRTYCSLRADTLALTAPPYVYGNLSMGCTKLNTLLKIHPVSHLRPLMLTTDGGRLLVLVTGF